MIKAPSTSGKRPDDSWLRVWQEANRKLGKAGEYDQSDKQLEVWGMYSEGGSIEVSTEAKEWSAVAEKIRGQRFAMGLVALRSTALDLDAAPGVTMVVETPGGGSMGARILMELLGSLGIGGVLARQECSNRWGVVKLIYCPAWYAAAGDKTFGIDWPGPSEFPRDENELKRQWCEHVAGAMKRVRKKMPSTVLDSLFFDCYASFDRLGELSEEEVGELASTDATLLDQHLRALSSKT